jgi:hypothetical protein
MKPSAQRVGFVSVLASVVVLAVSVSALAAWPLCPVPDFECLMIWDPVICDGGQIYSNQCVADQHCATGCVPYGEGVLMGGGCDKPKRCPLLWAPVICDDGKVYANECWARKKCATGCEPYEEGLALGGEDKIKPGSGCPRKGVMCPDVWDPVICDDGQIYSNSCYAWVWCATGCEPYGDGGPFPLKKSCPWEDLQCPDIYDPVECGGVEYPNACYALADCCIIGGGGGLMAAEENGMTMNRGDFADKKSCPWEDLQCPDVYDPVECGGVEYPNACYALADCCFVGGGGLMPADENVLRTTRNRDNKKLRLCPWWDLQCPDVWDPVECDGMIYSNACYALRACAENCTEGGASMSIEDDDLITSRRHRRDHRIDPVNKITCPFEDLRCPDIWDPVSCNGVPYPNNCYALAACAPGCNGF